MSAVPRKGIRSPALVALLCLGVGACSSAESRDAPESSDAPEGRTEVPTTPTVRTLEAGTTMSFTVDRTVSTDTDGIGDAFTATLLSPVFDSDGNELVAAGSPSTWVVTEASTENGQSVLAIRLESIELAGDRTPVAATVVNASMDTDDPDSDQETAVKIGVGAAAGAIVGQVLGRSTESTLAGAGVGAVVGTAVALSTRGGHATLPAGSRLEVRIDEPVTIS
jgi:hypothetical protein